MPNPRYASPKKRQPVTPPHVSIAALRQALGLRQVDVLEAMGEILGRPFTAGALSAIEKGHRGASADVLRALEIALGLRDGDLVTDYLPSHPRLKESA